ncbi:GH14835 [Drosophila grimshawi]|uniref:GH14835 n=1 Tax=Drosophila grimshawi TaxID=7222 RepID=B4JUX9_DROGR|nr:GH14835 [Drosophila grimshawi]
MVETKSNGNGESMVHPAPSWLTESYVESILRRYKQDVTLAVRDLDITPATSKGENYASVMTRIKVEYVCVKTTYENDPFISNVLATYNTSITEMIMYDKILPELSRMLEDTDQSEKLFAKTLHVDDEHSAIIFEDLSVSNYVLGDRLTGFDLELTKLVLRKLAKMHATAAVYNELQPGFLTKLQHGIFNRHSRAFAPMFENLIGVAAQFAGQCPELGSVYEKKLKRLQKHVMEYTEMVYDPKPDEFNTLTHGDLWTNNIMLRPKTDQNEVDLLLIDFQFSAWASPAVDFYYFFSTSLQSQVRIDHHDALIQFYHRVLVDTLHILNFKGYIPTLRQLVLQLERGKFMAVTALLTCQAIMVNDNTDDADFNALMVDNERGRNFRRRMYNNKRIQEHVKHWLPVFDRCGLLDVLN